MNKVKTTIFFLLFIQISFAQNKLVLKKTFSWDKQEVLLYPDSEELTSRLQCKDCFINEHNGITPMSTFSIPLNKNGILKARIIKKSTNASEFELSPTVIKNLPGDIVISTSVEKEKNQYWGSVTINGAWKKGNKVYLLENIQIETIFIPKANTVSRKPPKKESILNIGSFYKFAIQKQGMHSLSGKDLIEAGIDLSNVSSNSLQLYGNPGGRIPQKNSADRYDDLDEIPMLVQDGGDGVFNESDRIVFFADDASKYHFDKELNYYRKDLNPYENVNYVFLKMDGKNGKRISQQLNYSEDLPTQNHYLHITRIEDEKYNLLEEAFGHEGSNNYWFGDQFSSSFNSKDYTPYFDFNDYVNNSESYFTYSFANRSSFKSSVKISLGDKQEASVLPATTVNSQYAKYAYMKTHESFPKFTNNPTTLTLEYNGVGSTADGWLDYIEWQYHRKLNYTNEPIHIRSQKSASSNRNFAIKTSKELSVWNITDYYNVKGHNTSFSNGELRFSTLDEGGNNYVIFDNSASFEKPLFIKKIENQNLHSITDADMLIITTSSLLAEVKRLASHRNQFNKFDVKVIDVNQLYNEFGGGKCDPSAIRDFIKMVYDRSVDLKHVLLFGRGSFDYRGIKYNREEFNLIPVFEYDPSTTVIDPLKSHPSDDFFVLLDQNEGEDLKGKLDLSIGRIPVNNLSDAKTIVDKIIEYETDTKFLGDWNLTSIFAADDQDGNLHVNQIDRIAEKVKQENKALNPEKIYFDAFIQKSTPGGERYPEVSAEINKRIFKGALTFCYLGHGGPSGWAQERVLQVNDINNWTNENSFPLFITATCTFAPYDDPSMVSAGEKVIINRNGGIALYTTSRPVYAHDNERLTTAVFDTVFTRPEGEYLGLGEILRRSKNSNSQDTFKINARKFSLLGDPALKLRMPELNVYTTKINNKDASQAANLDTLKALSQISIEGFVGLNNEIAKDFNGNISVTVFDKQVNSKTLGQDKGSYPKEFLERKNIIFKGNAQVIDGQFKIEFYVPKDILFDYGKGKISYYAHNEKIGASGEFTEIIVGGSDKNGIQDDTPPVVQVFMNNENFVSGGITNPNPLLYVIVTDDYGINLSGTGIGHDLVGVLDKNAQTTYILNDFFESELNNFKKGYIKYPLTKLENGKHQIRVEAWDIANNVGEGMVEFVVSDDPSESLRHVLNYPNPFSNSTCFQFEHNYGYEPLDIRIDIYSVSGKLVKSLIHQSAGDGFRINDIKWDGTNDYGAKLSSGVYLYRVNIKSMDSQIKKQSNFEKLVIIR